MLNTLKTTGSEFVLLKCRISQTSRSKGPDFSVSVQVPVPTNPGLERPTFEPQLRWFQKNGHCCNGIKAKRCANEADDMWRDTQIRKEKKK